MDLIRTPWAENKSKNVFWGPFQNRRPDPKVCVERSWLPISKMVWHFMIGSVVWMLKLLEMDAKIWQIFWQQFWNLHNCSMNFRLQGSWSKTLNMVIQKIFWSCLGPNQVGGGKCNAKRNSVEWRFSCSIHRNSIGAKTSKICRWYKFNEKILNPFVLCFYCISTYSGNSLGWYSK